MKASTSGSSTTSRATRCRSAATSSPGASWRQWSCATRSCASFRERWGMRIRRSRSHSARPLRERPSTRTTRGRPNTGAGGCRTSCSPATTRGSGRGGLSRVASEAVRWTRRRRDRASDDASGEPRSGRPLPWRVAQGPTGSVLGPPPSLDRRCCRRQASLMSTVIDSLESAQLRRAPAFAAGDRVRVHFQVVEGTRRRTQVFEGVVIKRHGHGVRETFTVRKQSFGVGVERTFPLHSPKIERIEIAARGDVRRAKLYYLRGRVGKRARVRERRNIGPEEAVERGLVNEATAEPAQEDGAAADAEAVAVEDIEAAPVEEVEAVAVEEAPAADEAGVVE